MTLKEELEKLSDALWEVSPNGQASPNAELFDEYWKWNDRITKALISDFHARFGISPVLKSMKLFLDNPQLSSCFSVHAEIGFWQDTDTKITCELVIDHPRCLMRVEKGRDSREEKIREACEDIIRNYTGQTFWANLW